MTETQDSKNRPPSTLIRQGWWIILLAGVGLLIYNLVKHNPFRIGGPGTLYVSIIFVAVGVVGGVQVWRSR